MRKQSTLDAWLGTTSKSTLPNITFCCAPRDRAPVYPRPSIGSECPGCSFICLSEDGGVFESMHRSARNLILRGCGIGAAVLYVSNEYEKLRSAQSELPVWELGLIYEHLGQHLGDLQVQSRILADLVAETAASLRDMCWEVDDECSMRPNAPTVRLMVSLYSLHESTMKKLAQS